MSTDESQLDDLNTKISQIKYLILDPKNIIKNTAYSTLNSLGVNKENIYCASSIEEAIRFLLIQKPSYLACFIEKDDKEIFKLIDEHKKLYPNNFDRFFLAFSRNKSIYTFAQALEEEIDDYIVEPYSQKKLLEKIQKSIRNKSYPTQYKYILNEVSAKIDSKDYSGAIGMANIAMALHPRPSMVFYYLAKINMLENKTSEAIKDAIQGLRFNKEHYRCLLMLHDLYFKTKNFDNAYKVLKKVFNTFPLSMLRIYDMFKLAIFSGEFKDLDKYCTKILEEGTQNIDIVRFCTAGISVCGYNALKNENEVEGISYLEKALKHSELDPKVIRNIFKIYVQFGLYNNSESTYAKFTLENQKTLEFKICAYIREIQTNKPINMIIDEAPDRLKDVQYDEDCFHYLYKRVLKEAPENKIYAFTEYAKSLSLIKSDG